MVVVGPVKCVVEDFWQGLRRKAEAGRHALPYEVLDFCFLFGSGARSLEVRNVEVSVR